MFFIEGRTLWQQVAQFKLSRPCEVFPAPLSETTSQIIQKLEQEDYKLAYHPEFYDQFKVAIEHKQTEKIIAYLDLSATKNNQPALTAALKLNLGGFTENLEEQQQYDEFKKTYTYAQPLSS